MRKNWTIWIVCGALLLAAVLLIGCQSSTSQSTTAPADTAVAATAVPAMDGAALLQSRCTACHGVEKVTREKKTADGWTAIVNDMIGKGAQLTKDEKAALIEYLAQTYTP